MAREEAIETLKENLCAMCAYGSQSMASCDIRGCDNRDAIKVLEQEPIDKSAMMHGIYMEGVNMTGEYQGCWVRFRDIEKIVNKYMTESEDKE